MIKIRHTQRNFFLQKSCSLGLLKTEYLEFFTHQLLTYLMQLQNPTVSLYMNAGTSPISPAIRPRTSTLDVAKLAQRIRMGSVEQEQQAENKKTGFFNQVRGKKSATDKFGLK